ncbi:hypothetical protein AB0M95_12270 [Sphaerisporangium sp. NPDC051017]|uniref:hypothetical protein n=1 Tax=Sphaerisporangium sp. NPDC051017 TaxID=3154636 RepID=UPI00343B3AB9
MALVSTLSVFGTDPLRLAAAPRHEKRSAELSAHTRSAFRVAVTATARTTGASRPAPAGPARSIGIAGTAAGAAAA